MLTLYFHFHLFREIVDEFKSAVKRTANAPDVSGLRTFSVLSTADYERGDHARILRIRPSEM